MSETREILGEGYGNPSEIGTHHISGDSVRLTSGHSARVFIGNANKPVLSLVYETSQDVCFWEYAGTKPHAHIPTEQLVYEGEPAVDDETTKNIYLLGEKIHKKVRTKIIGKIRAVLRDHGTQPLNTGELKQDHLVISSLSSDYPLRVLISKHSSSSATWPGGA